ncbi:UNVERIFIED_CONTAM: hypothetical protein GTU68_054411, partial [Idotea baltica]|nr:hypothetical protein [Idotea baltica]MCL4159087.1 hypothetical protein [Idotea baltica]
HFEVLSLTGTVSPIRTHLHICLSDNEGPCIGGHVVSDLIVFTTMEILLGESTEHVLTRELDPKTGYYELVVNKHFESK